MNTGNAKNKKYRRQMLEKEKSFSQKTGNNNNIHMFVQFATFTNTTE